MLGMVIQGTLSQTMPIPLVLSGCSAFPYIVKYKAMAEQEV
jgi:hypothetical protein